MIEVADLCRHYQMGDQRIAALDGVSFAIGEGELVAIVGRSGSGKSTLMNVLGCLDLPSSGRYVLDGQDVHALDDDSLAEARNRRIGFIFQNFQLMNRTSALSNVELPLVYRGIARRRRREMARAALDKVGLGDRMDHKPTQLSGGQRQRVAIARALVGSPAIVLADEPTGNLDSTTEREIMDLLHELHGAGHTIIIVTHEPSVAGHCPRAIRLADGRVVFDGSGRQVERESVEQGAA